LRNPPKPSEEFDKMLQFVLKKCREIVTAQRDKYEDAWYEMSFRTLDGVIAYKAKRMLKIPRRHLKKLIDDHIDVVNLAIMALVRLREEIGWEE